MRPQIYIPLLIFFLSDACFAQIASGQNLNDATVNKSGNGQFTDSAFVSRRRTSPIITGKFQFPQEPIGWTSDFENILSEAQINELDSAIAKFEKETGTEIAIVTFDSSWVQKEYFDEMVTAIGNNWGIGKPGLDNGIVIGISIRLRTIRVSNGSGIGQRLSDVETKKIIDLVIIPEFKKGAYFEGIKKGVLRIMQKVK